MKVVLVLLLKWEDFHWKKSQKFPTDADDVNMDVQKGSSSKETSGPFSSANPPISVAAPKPLSSNMDSIYVLPTKTPSFA